MTPICSICQRAFSPEICRNDWTLKHGNNAWPVNEGKCCDVCNDTVVVLARLASFSRKPAPGDQS